MAAWILRRQGADVLPSSLQRRRLYVLPTRAGVGFGLLLLAMLIAGLNYGNSLALFLTFWLAGLALVAMHQCHRNLLALIVNEAAVSPTFAGGYLRLAVALANDSRLARYRVSLDVEPQFWNAGTRSSRATADLPPGESGVLELALAAPQRGIYRLRRLRLSTTHPFGLFRAWTWIHLPLTAIVYPAARGTRPPPQAAATEREGALRGGADEQEWLGLRPFRSGDSPRHVAWKAYARGAPLLTKEYSANLSALRLFDLASLAELPLEARLEQLARWIVDAENRGERYALQLPETQLEPGSGAAQQHRALTALAAHGAQLADAH
ncbi:MAG TPA: DUF58 domain-containing protein [Steroidobacteraceae bacterium]|nr:DUF58 domain-containing protein [Steroidobacteraceae bacterium]